MDADWAKPGEGDEECKITVYGNDYPRVGIYCWQHSCWAQGTFRDNSEAHHYFRCDHGQNLRFLLVDPNPIEQDALPTVLSDLTDVVYTYTHEYEDMAHGADDPVNWSLYIIRINEVGVPALHQCKVRMVDAGSWDENDVKSVSYVVDDENGQLLTHFSVQIDGRA